MTRTQVAPRTRARHKAVRARARRERAVGIIAEVAAAVIALSVLAGILSDGQWPWAFATYLRWPQTIVGTVAAGALLYLRWWRTGVMFALVAAGLIVSVAAPLTALTTVDATADRTVRVAVYNTGAGRDDVARFARAISEVDADIVVLLESADIADRLAEQVDGLARLPTSPSADRNRAPPAVLARERWPVQILPLAGNRPASVVSMTVDGAPLDVVAFHPLPPVTRSWTVSHNRSIDAMVESVLPREVPYVLACDCNSAPWSPSMRRLLDVGLRAPTVVPTFGVPLLGIPLDHVLLSDDVAAVRRGLASFDGSDHRMIVTDITLR
ncbi:hypothetical protein BH23ACT10_BH23ACT10_05940 [soil metagenome]